MARHEVVPQLSVQETWKVGFSAMLTLFPAWIKLPYLGTFNELRFLFSWMFIEKVWRSVIYVGWHFFCLLDMVSTDLSFSKLDLHF